VKVAIPILNDLIAPCFEAARKFYIAVINDGAIENSETIQCHSCEGFMNVRILRLHEVQILICNGIKSFYRDQLSAIGIYVLPNINDSIKSALDRYTKGELLPNENAKNDNCCNELVSHDELVLWAKNYFEAAGYNISVLKDEDTFMIDLVAVIDCPVCRKRIEVAICCGAQTYRADQEIREFYHLAKLKYNARVYVYLTNPQIEKSCDDYGINFISPEWSKNNLFLKNKYRIPILQRPVEGHEKAFGILE